jgi:hypothetical protein
MSFESDLMNEQEKYKDIHKTHVKKSVPIQE